MSSTPSILSLGQLLELCKRYPDVIHMLSANPAAVDSLSKYPERSLAALTGVDAIEDVDEDDIPYGLSSMGTSDMLKRVQSLSALEISYDRSDITYAHEVVGRTMSGNMVRHRVPCTDKTAQRTGCTTVLLLRGPHQPYIPDRAGALGVLLSATSRLEEWAAFENVFISQTQDGKANSHEEDDWLYAGRYELKECRPLDEEEIVSLPEESYNHWVQHIQHAKGGQYDRLRARVYLSVKEHKKNVTEADVDHCVANDHDDTITATIRRSEIRDALGNGTITLQAFSMRPVGYDVGIPMLLQETRKRLEAEEEADDAGIEVISGPPRGTKRKTPPVAIEGPRPAPGPSTSSLPRAIGIGPTMFRSKRRAVVSPVKYHESDSEGDLEPARVAGPSSAGSSSNASQPWSFLQ